MPIVLPTSFITIHYTETSNQSSISDLTNTTWVINSTTCTAGYGIFNIDYTCSHQGGDYNCDTMWIGYRATSEEPVQQANTVVTNDIAAYQLLVGDTIAITGGTDATSSGSGFASLVSWLEANATQQGGSTSLSGTKWRFKDNPDLSSFPAAGTSYSINFVSNSNSYTSLKLATYSITYNTTEVYTRALPLTAPSVTLSSDELTITDNDGNATGFKVYWDSSTTVAETITKTS